ncbi:MAG: hypothetical protein ACX939_02285 [Hyphococcus sp.]
MLIAAAGLLIVLAGFHTVVGERVILQPVRKADNLPKMWNSRQATFRTIQATWHLVSVLWLGVAACLMAIQFFPALTNMSFLLIFGAIFGALAVVPLVWNAGKHKTWIPFGLICVLLLGEALLR